MKILVTGISGFIGSHVAAALAALGHDVTGVYRHNPPRKVPEYEHGFMNFPVKKGTVTPQQADISDGKTVEKLTRGMDGVIHIAGRASDWGTREQFYRANFMPIRHFIAAFQNNAPRFFIHTSTISVYGFGAHRHTTEEGPYYRITHPYQTSKLASEKLLFTYAAENSSPALAIIRPANVYGPGDTTLMYPILNAVNTGKMGLVNKGRYLTSPIFIDDLVSAYIALMNTLTDSPQQVHGRTYNITSGEIITWEEKIALCAATLKCPIPKLTAPRLPALIAAYGVTGVYHLIRSKTPPDLTVYRVKHVSSDYHFSINRAIHDLHWKPETFFREGIIPTVKAWREYMSDRYEKK
ncbi:MAG: NAD-dependent epimerase/dehydratase family protein [Salinispira sp.]